MPQTDQVREASVHDEEARDAARRIDIAMAWSDAQGYESPNTSRYIEQQEARLRPPTVQSASGSSVETPSAATGRSAPTSRAPPPIPPVQRHPRSSQIPGARLSTSEYQGHDVDERAALEEAERRSLNLPARLLSELVDEDPPDPPQGSQGRRPRTRRGTPR